MSKNAGFLKFLRFDARFMRKLFFKLWNFWPPFFGAGIVIDEVSDDFMSLRVRLKKRPWTQNLIGTQFGGSMFAMVDPFYMTLMTLHLGHSYRVIDKSASIAFKRLGKTELTAKFVLTKEDLDFIKNELSKNEKMDFNKTVEIFDKENILVAEVQKVMNIKKKS